MTSDTTLDRERTDVIQTLDKHRGFLRQTIEGMSEDQARTTSTVSALTLAAILQHVTAVERQWRTFILEGTGGFANMTPEDYAREWAVPDDVTLAELVAAYDAGAAETDAVVASIASLDTDHALPEAPWFEPGARWSARRTLLHIIAETSQHAGHADIIREAIDGAKTMG